MSSTERFLTLFAEAEGLVAAAAGRSSTDTGKESFASNLREVDRRDGRFRRVSNVLRACASLRNVLVHERFESQYLAEPRLELVEQLQRIVDNLKNPPKVTQHFRNEIREFSPEDRIDEVLRYTATKDYSQVVVRCNGTLDLLSANTIQRWLAHHADQLLVELDVPVAQVLSHREPDTEEIKFADRETTLVIALEYFYGGQADSLLALIITEKGKATEKPLAFVTPWDLGKLAHILEGK